MKISFLSLYYACFYICILLLLLHLLLLLQFFILFSISCLKITATARAFLHFRLLGSYHVWHKLLHSGHDHVSLSTSIGNVTMVKWLHYAYLYRPILHVHCFLLCYGLILTNSYIMISGLPMFIIAGCFTSFFYIVFFPHASR